MARTKAAARNAKRAANESGDAPSPKKIKAASRAPSKKKKAGAEKLTADDFEPSEINLNERLTEPLSALAKEELELGNKFKGISIKNAVLMLKKYPKVITSGEEALKLKGIGKSIAQKIDDILESGAIQRSEESDVNDKLLGSIDALKKVYGISPSLAASLVREHNISSVVDLVGRQELLDKPAKIGLKYFKDFHESIPRSEVEAILNAIKSQAQQIGDVETRECGNYTRGDSVIEEILVVITSSDKSYFTKLTEALQQSGLITDVISSSDAVLKSVCISPSALQPQAEKAAAPSPAPAKVFSIPKFSQIQRTGAVQAPNLFAQRGSEPRPDDPVVHPSSSAEDGHSIEKPSHFHRRLELRYCSKAAFPIFFTHLLGPASFFQHLQKVAQMKGYSLTAKTLREHPERESPGKHIHLTSEQGLFEILGLDFIPYNKRASFQKVKTEN